MSDFNPSNVHLHEKVLKKDGAEKHSQAVLGTLDDLKFFLEQDNFIEYNGELFYLGDDREALEAEGFEFEEADFEVTGSLCTRRNVGCNPIMAQPYKEGFNVDELESAELDGLRLLDQEDGIIPDSNYLVLNKIKVVPDGYETSKPDHVIYSKEHDSYFCIKNGCTECNVVPHKIPNRMQVVSADISAQEPMASTLVTREPKWQEVFELKNFRYDPTLLQYMDMIIEDHLRVSKRDITYVLFVHNTYYYERSDIYKLNLLVEDAKKDESLIPELEAHIQIILDKYNAYVEKLSTK